MGERTNYGKLKAVVESPDLIEIQLRSYSEFLQMGVNPLRRKRQGLQSVFKEVFPIESYDGRYVLDFQKYELSDPKLPPEESLYEGQTFSAPLHVTFSLKDGEEVREESVYMGEVPLMTANGSFVVNGAERVVVSQLHRSPGICSEQSVHANGTILYSVRLIPDRGSWLEIMFDTSEQIWIYMDRKKRRRKFLAATFLRALGFGTDEELLGLYYSFEKLNLGEAPIQEEALTNLVFREDVTDADSKTLLAKRLEPITAAALQRINDAGIKTVKVVNVGWDDGIFLSSVRSDPTRSTDDALKDIYHKLRPGDPATPSNTRQHLKRLFFDNRRYDLGRVGRYKINQKLGLQGKVDDDLRVLDKTDIVEAVRHLIRIRKNEETVDDIDHLGSRRIRTVGELLENQCRVGLARTERLIRERMTLFDPATGPLTPQRLVNSKSLSAVVQDFFGRSQLSQFMDQTNPLSELAHKRRLSALGPGGLSRERAGFEVRDVHSSHYGRICPIETPEGPNIGLISSLGIYAKVNEFGFIESPYRKVINGRVTDDVEYLTADREEKFVIAQANAPLDDRNRFALDSVAVRFKGEFLEVPRDRVEYMDVSPMQVVSIAAGLIPFLEHDDANRALMGANMMRQAVPLIRTERAFVSTGLEEKVARDSRVAQVSTVSGKVAYASADVVVVSSDGKMPAKGLKNTEGVHHLQKFRRTNSGTCFNQKPIVNVGDSIRKGQIIADGPGTSMGELALGRNLLVAFMPWCGYNFEDAILISERVVRDDIFTSVHVSDFEVSARDTKLGPEEITRDIPNVGEEALKNLGVDGVIRVGAEVRPGDILVGKITPKSETELDPEERLLRAIFGEKAAEVRDTSLTVPSGTTGIVMDIKVTAHKEVKRSEMTATERRRQMKSTTEEYKVRRQKLADDLTESLSNILLGEKIPLDVVDAERGEIIIPANRKITKTLLRKLAAAYEHVQIESSPIQIKIEEIIAEFRPKFAELDMEQERVMDRLESGDDVDQGIIKQVRVSVATKKKLAVGDKLAGRHGNKGVVARIVADSEMPFQPDGTPVDIVLNPLGVPSRMNLGQLFETHMGAACKVLGMHSDSPVFDGISEENVRKLLVKAGIPEDGKSILYDGRTGEPFDQRVVVGQIYMMKLHHLVSDKIHARAVGPYSLVTQQPLGGKAQYGGQRLGEMEVWALEAYGVAFLLQELLTVKSDDVQGRTLIYESIVKGEHVLQAGMPESFNVLVNELRGLCLNMEMMGGEGPESVTPVL